MRMTLAEIIERRGTINWEKVNATTDEDIARHVKEDGIDDDIPGPAYPIPATVR